MKIGKTAAFLIGGGIIFLEVANEQGWIKIDCMFVNAVVMMSIFLPFSFKIQGTNYQMKLTKPLRR